MTATNMIESFSRRQRGLNSKFWVIMVIIGLIILGLYSERLNRARYASRSLRSSVAPESQSTSEFELQVH